MTQQCSENTTSGSTTKATEDAVAFRNVATVALVRDYNASGGTQTGADRPASKCAGTPLAWLSQLVLHRLKLCASCDGGSQEGGANHCGYAFYDS